MRISVMPSLLIMRAVHLGLIRSGLRLRASIVSDTGEVKNAHEAATLLGFGASAVCPYLALELARHFEISKVKHLLPDERERRFIETL